MRLSALILVMLVIVGCGDKKVTGNADGGAPPPVAIPGLDGMTVATPDIRLFWNLGDGAAIAMIPAVDAQGQPHLFASYHNGSTWAPATELDGVDLDHSMPRSGFKVCFLHTSASQNASAANEGDAVLLWLGRDLSQQPGGPQDPNQRVYVSYFIKSLVGQPEAVTTLIGGVDTEVRHGFQVNATPVDTDNMLVGTGNDPDVISAGFVSDSLHGTHEVSAATAALPDLSGDPTTFVGVAYYKSPANMVSTATPPRWFVVPIDLTALKAQAPVLLPPPTDSGATPSDADAVDDRLLVVDNTVLSRHAGLMYPSATPPQTSWERTVVSVYRFGPGGLQSPAPFANLDPQDVSISMVCQYAPCDTTLPFMRDVYGPDDGVGSDIYVFYLQDGYSTRTNGAKAQDRDLMVAQIGASSVAVKELDAFRDPIDLTDGDHDTHYVRAGTDADVYDLSTMLHHGEQLISVVFLQPSTDLDDADDSNASIGKAARNKRYWVQALQTGRPAAALGSSVLAAALPAPALVSKGDVATGTTQADVAALAVPLGIATGQPAVFGGPALTPPESQSDPNRVFFGYTQKNDQAGAMASQVQLFVTGVRVAPAADMSQPPTATLLRDQVTSAVVPLGALTLPDSFSLGIVDGQPTGRDFLAFFVGSDSSGAPQLSVFDGTSTTNIASIANGPPMMAPYFVANTPEQVAAVWTEPLGPALKIEGASFAGTTAMQLSDQMSAPTQLDGAGGGDLNGGFLGGASAGAVFVAAEDDHIWETTLSANRMFDDRVQLDDGDGAVANSQLVRPPLETGVAGGVLFYWKDGLFVVGL